VSEQKLFFAAEENIGGSPRSFWPALVMTGEEIDQEIARLGSSRVAPSGRRRSFITHPYSSETGRGLAPGIDVAIDVLLPGERTIPVLENASHVSFCVRGSADCHVGSRTLSFETFDTWNIPSMNAYSYENNSSEPAVFLNYSNAPLLKNLHVYYIESNPTVATAADSADHKVASRRARDLALDVPIGIDGARLLGYEYLIDIDVRPSISLIWPWKEVSKHLGEVEHLGGESGRAYAGRHVAVLYNPATGRRIGTTHSFFASIAQFPPGRVDIPHRHTSAAINYIFAGSGRSTVDQRKFAWKSGDLMLSAPGWAVHNHASGEEGCKILTVQDHPLHIASESLIWQESLKGPIVKLGSEVGIQTNLGEIIAA
jgi:gentisate 1,2-dioxygenase